MIEPTKMIIKCPTFLFHIIYQTFNEETYKVARRKRFILKEMKSAKRSNVKYIQDPWVDLRPRPWIKSFKTLESILKLGLDKCDFS